MHRCRTARRSTAQPSRDRDRRLSWLSWGAGDDEQTHRSADDGPRLSRGLAFGSKQVQK